MRLPTSPLLAFTLLLTTLIACGDEPPAPNEVRSALTNDLRHVLREGQASMAATENLPTGSAFGFASLALDGGNLTGRALAPVTRFINDMSTAARDRTQSLDGEDGETNTDALVQSLNDELFTDANYLGDGVFRVPASLVCEQTTFDPDTGLETTAIDPDCAQRLDAAVLRIRVASEDGGLRFYVQVDANHDEPIAVFLSHTKLALTLNLDEASDAMAALAPVFDETAPNADLSGQITGALEILGTAHADLSLSFDRALAIKFADTGVSLDGPDATRLTSAAGEIISLDLDATASQATASLGLGATTAHIPGDTLDPQPTDLDLGGATVTASFQNNMLVLANLSLGSTQTTLSVGGQQAVAIDLNPADGRTLTATVEVDASTGDETLTVSPRLDLRTSIDHAVLGDEAPTYDVTRVLVEGSLRGKQLGGIEVVSGRVSVETNPAQYGFSAIAGQCVTETENYDEVTYQSYTTYAVTTCI